MIYKVFAVFDRKIATYNSPFCVPHLGLAHRSFEDAVNDTSTQLNKYPSDFSLWQVATFDDETAKYESALAHIVDADDLIKRPQLIPSIKCDDVVSEKV